jgi:hypothetical protein
MWAGIIEDRTHSRSVETDDHGALLFQVSASWGG